MPTLNPHEARELAESFGAETERYDRTRPRYPDAMVLAILAGSSGLDVLDVGIGTGISARPFRAAGCRVLGVEADERMAAFARRDGFDVETATFEAWDPAGRTFDAVLCGQAWHWIDPVRGAAKAGEVLRPGGRLALFWNVWCPGPEVAGAFADVQRRVLPDAPRNPWAKPALDGYVPILATATDAIRDTAAFRASEQWRFDWTRTYSREEWLDQLPTGADAARLPPAKLRELLAATGEAIDALGGRFTMPYATIVLTAART